MSRGKKKAQNSTLYLNGWLNPNGTSNAFSLQSGSTGSLNNYKVYNSNGTGGNLTATNYNWVTTPQNEITFSGSGGAAVTIDVEKMTIQFHKSIEESAADFCEAVAKNLTRFSEYKKGYEELELLKKCADSKAEFIINSQKLKETFNNNMFNFIFEKGKESNGESTSDI